MTVCEYHHNTLNGHTPYYHHDNSIENRLWIHAPLFAFLSLVLVLGIPMNMLVFYVYHFKIQSRIFGLFVEFLALFDIIYCALMIPLIVSFKLIPEYFDLEPTCRTMTFGVMYSLVTGGILLIIIAVQRQRSVCSSGGRQIDITLARRLCAFTPLLGALLALPIIFPVRADTVFVILPQKRANITTYTCQLHNFSHSALALFVTFFFFTEIAIICIVLSVLYIAVWRTIRRQLNAARTTVPSSRSKILAMSEASTKVFLVLSLIFCLTHLPPSLFLIIASQVTSTGEPRSWPFEIRVLVDMAAYIHFINSVANPIVYGVWCQAFRTECCKIFGCNAPRPRRTSVATGNPAGSSGTIDTV